MLSLLPVGAGSTAAAQSPSGTDSTPVPAVVLARALHAAEAKDASVRGAAARLLAATGDANHYPRIRGLAADPEAAARIPALLALGALGAPGAETVLERRLEKTKTNSLEQQVAAYALALLPNDSGSAALQRLVIHLGDRGYRRHVGVWAGILAGLHAAPIRAADPLARSVRLERVRALLNDRANRFGSLHRLAIGLLPVRDPTLLKQPVDDWLASVDADRRRTALAVLAKLGRDGHTEPRAKRLFLLTRKDRDARVRAGSIRLLTQWRDPMALDAALTGLRDSDPTVAAAAVATAYGLGGGSLRTSVERQIDRTSSTERRAAMLDSCPRAHSASFLERCLARAADRAAHDALRVAAAGVAARSDATTVAEDLVALFASLDDPSLLLSAARSITKIGAAPDLGKRLVSSATKRTARSRTSAPLGQRLEALLLAGHPDALAALTDAMRMPTTTPRDEVALLDAARRWLEQKRRPGQHATAAGPAPAVGAELPPQLSTTLR